MARRSTLKRVTYWFLHIVCRLAFVVLCRIRCFNRHLVPSAGGALLLSNHQSHLDPIVLGLACDRRLNYLARSTLFRFAPFRWLIQSLDAIPIEREGTGFGGLKETLKRLKRQEIVLIFPEGTRTYDGTIGPLRPGFCALAHRAGVPLVPVAIAGAIDAWPRWRRFPRPAVVQVVFGQPIMPREIQEMNEEQLLAQVRVRLESCHDEAERRLASSKRVTVGRLHCRDPRDTSRPPCAPARHSEKSH